MRQLLQACGLCFNMTGNRFRIADLGCPHRAYRTTASFSGNQKEIAASGDYLFDEIVSQNIRGRHRNPMVFLMPTGPGGQPPPGPFLRLEIDTMQRQFGPVGTNPVTLAPRYRGLLFWVRRI
jgi:hypothetical protein